MANKKSSSSSSKSKSKPDTSTSTSSTSSTTKPKPAASINARHILCEKSSKKDSAVAKLRDGAKFDDVAREFSEDKARQGGSLGWKRKGELDPEFEKVAFGLEVSTVGNPVVGEVKTGFGYHVVMVEGRR